MQLPPDIAIQQRLQKWSKYLAAVVMIVALLSLIGWQWNIAILKDPFSSDVMMHPVSGIGFIFSVLSLWLLTGSRRGYAGYALAIIVLLTGLLAFLSYVFGSGF